MPRVKEQKPKRRARRQLTDEFKGVFLKSKLHLARKQPAQALALLDDVQRWARSDEQRAAVQALIDEARRAAP